MSTTFERANKAIEALVQKAMESYHPDLQREGVTVDTVIVRRVVNDEDVHALKRSGYPIDAKIGLTSVADRARGIADAKLMIDGTEWNRATDRQRLALIDHELEHLTLVPLKPTKKEPNLTGNKRDDLGRPALKVRPHDWQIAGFKTVAERHGVNSHESMQFSHFRTEYAQLNFFGPPDVLAIANGNGMKAAKVPASQKSKACRNRHHDSCRADGCRCECGHKTKETHVNG